MSTRISYVAHPTDEPYSLLHRYVDRTPLACVYLDGGRLALNADDPMVLLRIAKECERAATMLADEALEQTDLAVRGA